MFGCGFKFMPTKTHVIVIGSNGRLGNNLIQSLHRINALSVTGYSRRQLDLGDLKHLNLTFPKNSIVINAAGNTNVDNCELYPTQSHLVNTEAVSHIARSCSRSCSLLIQISTDYVFDGKSKEPYIESDKPCPINVYGHTKLLAEETALTENPKTIVIRTAWLFGGNKPSFPEWFINLKRSQQPVKVICDRTGSPTFVTDLTAGIIHIIKRHPDATGLFHIVNQGSASWFELANFINQRLGCKVEVSPVSSNSVSSIIATRPEFSALNPSRAMDTFNIEIRHWRDALSQHIKDIEI